MNNTIQLVKIKGLCIQNDVLKYLSEQKIDYNVNKHDLILKNVDERHVLDIINNPLFSFKNLSIEHQQPASKSLALVEQGLTSTDAHILTFYEANLEQVMLQNNKLTTFALRGGLAIRYVNLAYNSIGDDQPTFAFLFGLPRLEMLNLAGNGITSIAIPAPNTSLCNLNLSLNSIASINNIISVLHGKLTLDITQNPHLDVIQALKTAISHRAQLFFTHSGQQRYLSPAGCETDLSGLRIADHFAFGCQCQRLNLADNSITTLSQVKGGLHLEQLNLAGNPLAKPDLHWLSRMPVLWNITLTQRTPDEIFKALPTVQVANGVFRRDAKLVEGQREILLREKKAVIEERENRERIIRFGATLAKVSRLKTNVKRANRALGGLKRDVLFEFEQGAQ